MVNGRQRDRMEAGIDGIVTAKHRDFPGNPDLLLQQRSIIPNAIISFIPAIAVSSLSSRSSSFVSVYPILYSESMLGILSSTSSAAALTITPSPHPRFGKLPDKPFHPLQPLPPDAKSAAVMRKPLCGVRSPADAGPSDAPALRCSALPRRSQEVPPGY